MPEPKQKPKMDRPKELIKPGIRSVCPRHPCVRMPVELRKKSKLLDFGEAHNSYPYA